MEISEISFIVMTTKDEKFTKVIYSHWSKLEYSPID